MTLRILGASVAAASLLGFLFAGNDGAVTFPKNYRKWIHVKSTLIGPQHAAFATEGGIHHFYANQKALTGYASGKFPDGSVLIDDLLETKENGGVTSEGAHRRIAVMVKNSKRYGETGGWGFEFFKGDPQPEGVLNAEGRAQCFACHGKQKGRDSVFSEFRK